MQGYQRSVVTAIQHGLAQAVPLIQLVTGPRQVGKTTAVRQLGEAWDGPVHYASADAPRPVGAEWIGAQWQLARQSSTKAPPLLVLDEVQKINGWSEVIKQRWDEDRASKRSIKVIVLGSSALMLSKGATESLAGRFLLHYCPHWSFSECQQAFGWTLEQWIFYGGYPGAASMIHDYPLWRAYITDSLIEAVLARDVMALHTIHKPSLLRSAFLLATQLPAQIMAYNKMLGQLQDAGNTTTLAHYIQLLERAFLLSGLQLFRKGATRQRASSPKLVLWNNALINAASLRPYDRARQDTAWWGRLVENAVGAHLLNHLSKLPYWIGYWRKGNHEVDFVVTTGQTTWAIEVKSGRDKPAGGIAAFVTHYPKAQPILIGTGGLSLDQFFACNPETFFQ